MTVSNHPLMDVAAVAEMLGVGERFVRRLIAERRIAFAKIGTHVRFAREDVEAFIAASRRETGVVVDPDDLASWWGLHDGPARSHAERD